MFSIRKLNDCAILSLHVIPNQIAIIKLLSGNIVLDGAITKAYEIVEAAMIESHNSLAD